MCLRFVTLENKSIITYFFFCSVSLRKWAITDFIVGQSIFGDNMSKKALIQQLNENIDDFTDIKLEIELLDQIGDLQWNQLLI